MAMKRHSSLILSYTSGSETLEKGFFHALIRIDHEKSLIVLKYSRKYRGCVSSLLVGGES